MYLYRIIFRENDLNLKNHVSKILILVSFLMAINLVVSTYYSDELVVSEELVENGPILENPDDKKSVYTLSYFHFQSLIFENQVTFYFRKNSGNFSSYEQDILITPPDFFRFSS